MKGVHKTLRDALKWEKFKVSGGVQIRIQIRIWGFREKKTYELIDKDFEIPEKKHTNWEIRISNLQKKNIRNAR